MQSTDTIYQDNFPDKVINPEMPAKIIFTQKELVEIFDKIEKANNESWIKNKLPNSTFVEANKLNNDYEVYYSSKPIMIRENTICIYYFGNTEWGKLSIYIKQNGEWKYFARLFEWVS